MKKIGIIGVNDKTPFFLKYRHKYHNMNVIGVYDEDNPLLDKYIKEDDVKLFSEPFGLIANADLLIIEKKSERTFNLIIESILNHKQIILENPGKLTLNEIQTLAKMAKEANVYIVPSLKYRYSPAIIDAKSYSFNTKYLEIQYSCSSKKTNADLDELLLDIIDSALCFTKGIINKINVYPITISHKSIQIINIVIELNNGCIMLININLLTTKEHFTLCVYQNNQIINIDLLRNKFNVQTSEASSPDIFNTIKNNSIQENMHNYSEISNYISAFESIDAKITTIDDLLLSFDIFNKVKERIINI